MQNCRLGRIQRGSISKGIVKKGGNIRTRIGVGAGCQGSAGGKARQRFGSMLFSGGEVDVFERLGGGPGRVRWGRVHSKAKGS